MPIPAVGLSLPCRSAIEPFSLGISDGDAGSVRGDFRLATRGDTENLPRDKWLCGWQGSAQNSDLPTDFLALQNSQTVNP